ncbi:MAG: glutathione S-transferase family protein [Solirubrobacterales bacterium]|nr:glutathione S-transferase family protein [Solirubrobacterales bacterium]
MPITEPVTMHVVPMSHPCMTARAGLEHKGIEFEEVMLLPGNQEGVLEGIYGDGNKTVPGIVVGEEPIHTSIGILRYIDDEVPENPLYPEAIANEVQEAEVWGDRYFQEVARRLPFGALHFRPGSMGTFAGAGELDAAGTDFAAKNLRGTWKYLRLKPSQLMEDLARIDETIDRIESYARDGILGGDEPTAADFQIASSARVLMTIGDLLPALDGSAAERIAMRYFPDYDGKIPAGAFPPNWISG